MRALVRRVLSASVLINDQSVGQIKQGLILYLAIHQDDCVDDLEWIAKKVLGLRVFEDEQGKMNLSIMDNQYELLLISQFTLFGSLKKGSRPSFHNAAIPHFALEEYRKFIQIIRNNFSGHLATGEFGADMQIQSIDDGPVTLWLDSKAKNY
jgi:D-tyrosyl-tRNA(Tyr) deacylase